MAAKLPEGVYTEGGKGKKPCPYDNTHYLGAKAKHCPVCGKDIAQKDGAKKAGGKGLAGLSIAQLQAEITRRTEALDTFGQGYKTWNEAREVIQAVLDLVDRMGGEDEVMAAISLKEESEE